MESKSECVQVLMKEISSINKHAVFVFGHSLRELISVHSLHTVL